MWSPRGPAAANWSLDGTATIKPFLEVSWQMIVGSVGESHGINRRSSVRCWPLSDRSDSRNGRNIEEDNGYLQANTRVR